MITNTKPSPKALVPQEIIESKIYLIRGRKVMLDSDLAKLYGVQTKVLNQAIKRNKKRFPADFMYQLTKKEYSSLRSHNVTLKSGRGRHRKYSPYVFTEPGIAMLSTVLTSETAIQINIQIIRTFIKLRKILAMHKDVHMVSLRDFNDAYLEHGSLLGDSSYVSCDYCRLSF